MQLLIVSGLIVFFGRILQDLAFNLKIEMFNRGKLTGVFGVNFIESIIGMYVIAMVVQYIGEDPRLLIFLGLGSAVGGITVIKIRDHLNRKKIGQRQYYARISFVGNEDLVEALGKDGYIFTVEEREFTDGSRRTVLEGSLLNRARKERLKKHLDSRPDLFVTIIPAREVYVV